MKQFSTTIHYDTTGELKDKIIQLHGELIGTGEKVNPTDHLQKENRSTRPVISPEIVIDEVETDTEQPTGLHEQLVKSASISNNEVDFDGIPWDERIHSSGKTKTGTGQWTKRKRLADGVYETVLAELKSKGIAFRPVDQSPVTVVQFTQPAPQLNIVQQNIASPQNVVEQTEPMNIPINTPNGQVLLTQSEYNLFAQPDGRGKSVRDILADRKTVNHMIQSQHQGVDLNMTNVETFSPVISTVADNAPTYDFKTFQASLPNVLSELFNKGLIDANSMNQLGAELQVPQLWMVMQDQNKATQLYDILGQRGLIRKANFGI